MPKGVEHIVNVGMSPRSAIVIELSDAERR